MTTINIFFETENYKSGTKGERMSLNMSLISFVELYFVDIVSKWLLTLVIVNNAGAR